MSARKVTFLVVGACSWLAGIGASFGALQRYAVTAGGARALGHTAADFIAAQRVPGRGLLVMAVHPLCPCTDASFAELGDLLARSQGRCDAIILEYQPAAPPADWPRAGSTRELGGQRARVLPDRGGRLAAALGAQTSGHAVFVDAGGEVRFQGGLTLSRGHRGRSPAQDAILAALAGAPSTLAVGPVYGCALEAACTVDCNLELTK